MSRLEELIQELCPDGVEYKRLDEVFFLKNGYTPSTKIPAFWDNGTIPWFRMEDIRTNGRILTDSIQHITHEAIKGSLFPPDSIILATSATIGEHALVTVEFLSNQRFTCLSRKPEFQNKINMRFFFHYCFILDQWCLNNTTLGNFLSVDMERLKKYRIPLPPLPVQEEIVRILDKFTTLEAALEAELEARKKQFFYYREKLLTPSDEVEWKALGEIATLVRGNGLQKKDFAESGVGCIHYGQIYTYYGTSAERTKSFVSPVLARTLIKVQKNDIVATNTSENVEDVCKAVAWLGNDEIVTGGHSTILRHNQNAKYLVYYMQTSLFGKQKRKYAQGTKVIEISTKNLERIMVPVPSIERQNSIVAVLDSFENLVNDITQGLPAELAARRRQYEYYRDKLLTFKEKAS